MASRESAPSRRVLVLGGTAEASRLAGRLAAMPHVHAILSLAGRTKEPLAQPIPRRVGGFGGVSGLRHWLREHAIDCLIDGTHPFARQMSANAADACRDERIPRAIFTRPPWHPTSADRWTDVPHLQAAAEALGPTPRRVFLPIGRGSVQPFATAPHHFYVVRSIDAADDLSFLPRHSVITGSPPFAEADERALLSTERIEVMVCKNSGGTTTDAKLAAARALGCPVIMVERPAAPSGPTYHTLEEVLAFIDAAD